MKRRSYALVGLGQRGVNMFLLPLDRDFRDVAEIVGICDTTAERVTLARRKVNNEIEGFQNAAMMLDAAKPEYLIVATPDYTHHTYVLEALKRGVNVICEKPITTSFENCAALLSAESSSRGTITATLNYRFVPIARRMKELLVSGLVGEIFSVEFSWFLDTVHGADYYRRWHREKSHSGGLLNHKSCHHFDFVNWLLDDEPELVHALAAQKVYGPHRKEVGVRCSGCKYATSCEFYYDLASDEASSELYASAETEDHYMRDACVFAPTVEIEDTYVLNVRYARGPLLSYCLHSYMPFEGWRMAMNGRNGRLECQLIQRTYDRDVHNLEALARRSAGRAVDPVAIPAVGAPTPSSPHHSQYIRFYPMFGGVQEFSVADAETSTRRGVPRSGQPTLDHSDADRNLREALFRGLTEDRLGQVAGLRTAIMASAVGLLAGKSLQSGRAETLRDYLDL